MELTPFQKTSTSDPIRLLMTSTNETIQAVQFVNLRTATNTLISDIWKKFIKMVETHLLEGKVLVNPNVQPDPNDPNFYCSSCGRNYKTRANYRKHIRLYHPSIKLEKIRKPSNVTTLMAEIDVGDDGNKRCAICEWEYDNRQNYKKHINTVQEWWKRTSQIKDKCSNGGNGCWES